MDWCSRGSSNTVLIEFPPGNWERVLGEKVAPIQLLPAAAGSRIVVFAAQRFTSALRQMAFFHVGQSAWNAARIEPGVLHS